MKKWFIVGFIALSTVVMALIGQPATLLVLAGALNGLILPITLGVCLIASQKKSIMGRTTNTDRASDPWNYCSCNLCIPWNHFLGKLSALFG